MDLLFYLLLIGAGVAADQSMDDAAGEFGDDVAAVAPDEPGLPELPELPSIEAPEVPADPADGAPAQPSVDAAGFVAEDQTVTGRMTTATEVRPILTATKGSWVAVREWDGNDLLYFTNLLAWRCGVHQVSYSVNGGPEEVLAAEPCYTDEGAPNALKVEDIQPYVTLPLQSLDTVTVTVLYDDLSTDSAEYRRDAIRID
jgi:hypothetical protein